jgi:sugar lactone lactonase YvrE
VPAPRPLMTGLVLGESPRWYEGRLWLCDWGAHEVVAVDLDGHREVTGPRMLLLCARWRGRPQTVHHSGASAGA